MKFLKISLKITFAFAFLTGVFIGCANAQTVDLGTDNAVLEQFGKLKNKIFEKDDVCIERLKKSANLIVVGFFAFDRGCRLEGVFVNSVYFAGDDAALSKTALLALGWKTAKRGEREKLALFWAAKGLLAFDTVLYTKGEDFTGGEFHPPQAVTRKNGETIVTLWTSVMKRKKEFHHPEFRFGRDGSLSRLEVNKSANSFARNRRQIK